jgi:hypothetical protein
MVRVTAVACSRSAFFWQFWLLKFATVSKAPRCAFAAGITSSAPLVVFIEEGVNVGFQHRAIHGTSRALQIFGSANGGTSSAYRALLSVPV